VKIGENAFVDDGKFVFQTTHDFNPELEYARKARHAHEAGLGLGPEYRPIATVPMALVDLWLKEAGVRWDDRAAADEVIKRKMLDGDFAKFRIDR
jgi:hypothetical protein